VTALSSETYARAKQAGSAISGARPCLLILGTRGIPASHGGFETFAEHLALYLVQRGWDVTVYCQRAMTKASVMGSEPIIDDWRGVRRVSFAIGLDGPLGTIAFDWRCVQHALHQEGVPLILGYNTAIFSLALRLWKRPVLMNMDGIEWSRAKWSIPARLWLYVNEWVGSLGSTKLIADHPYIADHLATRRARKDIAMIPYGGDSITQASIKPVEELGLAPGKYFLSVGRIEPENSVLELIRAYCARARKAQFACVGKLDPARNRYHREIFELADGRVTFLGAIYDQERIRALRFHALAYCHGHTVGGTNPSLVEALGAGNAVIAHDNQFNRWVAGETQLYFSNVPMLTDQLSDIENSPETVVRLRAAASVTFSDRFSWKDVLGQYETLCEPYAHIGRPGDAAIQRTSRSIKEKRLTS